MLPSEIVGSQFEEQCLNGYCGKKLPVRLLSTVSIWDETKIAAVGYASLLQFCAFRGVLRYILCLYFVARECETHVLAKITRKTTESDRERISEVVGKKRCLGI